MEPSKYVSILNYAPTHVKINTITTDLILLLFQVIPFWNIDLKCMLIYSRIIPYCSWVFKNKQ